MYNELSKKTSDRRCNANANSRQINDVGHGLRVQEICIRRIIFKQMESVHVFLSRGWLENTNSSYIFNFVYFL